MPETVNERSAGLQRIVRRFPEPTGWKCARERVAREVDERRLSAGTDIPTNAVRSVDWGNA